jgi:hypothetical protein
VIGRTLGFAATVMTAIGVMTGRHGTLASGSLRPPVRA